MTGSGTRSSFLPAVLSALIPGLGHIFMRRRYRGGVILIAFLIVFGMVVWFGRPLWYSAPVVIWIWNIWDAYTLSTKSRTRSALIPVLVGLIAAYGIGWQVVEIDFASADMERAIAVARPMLNPDFVEPRTVSNKMWTPIHIPCPAEGTVPPATRQDGSKTASATPDCATATDAVEVTVTGLWPDTDTQIWWETAIGDHNLLGGTKGNSMLVRRTDANGTLTTTINVPLNILIAQPDKSLSLQHKIHFDQYRSIGGYRLSVNGGYVVSGLLQTIAMALMATTIAILFAIPISFLAARNLMSGNPVTFVIYVVVRTILNIVRSIEAIIIAIVFVIIVGLGPFAGVLALVVHSVAALAKLYSEVIEGIDPGPIEAIRATGANWVQVVRYGVIPQIVPPFTAFTVYRWDINVRMSTIIGYVGGGGIGFYLVEWIRIGDFRGVGAAFIGIALVVVLLDYFSAKVRERLV